MSADPGAQARRLADEVADVLDTAAMAGGIGVKPLSVGERKIKAFNDKRAKLKPPCVCGYAVGWHVMSDGRRGRCTVPGADCDEYREAR